MKPRLLAAVNVTVDERGRRCTAYAVGTTAVSNYYRELSNVHDAVKPSIKPQFKLPLTTITSLTSQFDHS
jgi:hypothetical protein